VWWSYFRMGWFRDVLSIVCSVASPALDGCSAGLRPTGHALLSVCQYTAIGPGLVFVRCLSPLSVMSVSWPMFDDMSLACDSRTFLAPTHT
jgi:hypothetical protein